MSKKSGFSHRSKLTKRAESIVKKNHNNIELMSNKES
jgi:hypothetical protein